MRWLADTDSTMVEAHRLAEDGAPHGTAVGAVRQTAGRGRQGKSWESPAGGLWLSVVLRPPRAEALDALSLRVGLAIADAIEARCPELPHLQLKWPNDLFADGRKAGGILTEGRWQGSRCLAVVVGVGLNLLNPLPAALAETAVALGTLVPPSVRSRLEPRALAGPVVSAIRSAARGGPLDAAELAAWHNRDFLAGRTIRSPVEGVIEGVSAEGALVVRGEDGVRHSLRSGVVTPAS
jgi:BirA family biotin operon repressor/biotin-[acetyl-CoA-carboxylase] ligase